MPKICLIGSAVQHTGIHRHHFALPSAKRGEPNPTQTVTFYNGVADVDENIAQYLKDAGMASDVAIISEGLLSTEPAPILVHDPETGAVTDKINPETGESVL